MVRPCAVQELRPSAHIDRLVYRDDVVWIFSVAQIFQQWVVAEFSTSSTIQKPATAVFRRRSFAMREPGALRYQSPAQLI